MRPCGGAPTDGADVGTDRQGASRLDPGDDQAVRE